MTETEKTVSSFATALRGGTVDGKSAKRLLVELMCDCQQLEWSVAEDGLMLVFDGREYFMDVDSPVSKLRMMLAQIAGVFREAASGFFPYGWKGSLDYQAPDGGLVSLDVEYENKPGIYFLKAKRVS